jgi:hypothetical protein
MKINTWESDIPKDWTLIAEVDESESYEVDQSRIYKSSDGFVLATASGCSCWGGDWEVEHFAELDALYMSIKLDDRQYNPSWKAADELHETALRWISDNEPVFAEREGA